MSLLIEVDRRVEAAARALEDQLGNQTLCQLQRDGRVSGGLKYEEGRLVALQTLRRHLVTAPETEWPGLVQQQVAQWQARLDHQSPSLPWRAYHQGGVDAMTALTELVE